MGYKVIYNQGKNVRYIMKRKDDRKWKILIVALLFTSIVLIGLFPAGRNALRDFLLPGDPEITMNAFSNLIESVRDGNRLKDTVTAFCLEILHEGQK